MATFRGAGQLPGSSLGQSLTSPQAPQAGLTAADINPQDLNLWQKFMQKLRSDPNLRMALLQTGIGMQRTPDFGKNQFDVFADSAQGGIQTLDALRQRDTATEAGLRGESREERQIDIQEQSLGVREQQLEQSQRNFEASLEQSRQRMEEAQRHNKVTEATSASGQDTGAERERNVIVGLLQESQPELYGEDVDPGGTRAKLASFRFMEEVRSGNDKARAVLSIVTEEARNASLFKQEYDAKTATARWGRIWDELSGTIQTGSPTVPPPAGAQTVIPTGIHNGAKVNSSSGVGTAVYMPATGDYVITVNGVAGNERFSESEIAAAIAQ